MVELLHLVVIDDRGAWAIAVALVLRLAGRIKEVVFWGCGGSGRICGGRGIAVLAVVEVVRIVVGVVGSVRGELVVVVELIAVWGARARAR